MLLLPTFALPLALEDYFAMLNHTSTDGESEGLPSRWLGPLGAGKLVSAKGKGGASSVNDGEIKRNVKDGEGAQSFSGSFSFRNHQNLPCCCVHAYRYRYRY